MRGSPSILTSILTDERTNIHLPVTLLSKADEILLEGLENDSFSLPVSMQLRMAQNSTQRFKAMQGSPSLTKYVVDRMNRQEIVHHMQIQS